MSKIAIFQSTLYEARGCRRRITPKPHENNYRIDEKDMRTSRIKICGQIKNIFPFFVCPKIISHFEYVCLRTLSIFNMGFALCFVTTWFRIGGRRIFFCLSDSVITNHEKNLNCSPRLRSFRAHFSLTVSRRLVSLISEEKSRSCLR